jgi:hypothetical protein
MEILLSILLLLVVVVEEEMAAAVVVPAVFVHYLHQFRHPLVLTQLLLEQEVLEEVQVLLVAVVGTL